VGQFFVAEVGQFLVAVDTRGAHVSYTSAFGFVAAGKDDDDED
jgi:hypothetical protein